MLNPLTNKFISLNESEIISWPEASTAFFQEGQFEKQRVGGQLKNSHR